MNRLKANRASSPRGAAIAASSPPHQLRLTKADLDNIIAGITSAAEKVCK